MIYVMSDIHGHLRRYKDIMRQIRLRKDDHLYVLGDVIDRGRHGLPILMDLIRRPNVTVLLGNHEHMMLEALRTNSPESLYLWHMNGGYATHARYYFHPPQELIDEANEWAASEGMTLNDEEAEDMARLRIGAYIAAQVRERFPDVHYRKAVPPTGNYPTGLKYPSRSFRSEDIIDPDLYAQVQSLMSRG